MVRSKYEDGVRSEASASESIMIVKLKKKSARYRDLTFGGKIIHDDPEVAHDLFKVCPEWNWIPFAQSLHLNADELSACAVICNDVDTARIPRRWHDVPTKQGKMITTIVEANIARDLWIQLHSQWSLLT